MAEKIIFQLSVLIHWWCSSSYQNGKGMRKLEKKYKVQTSAKLFHKALTSQVVVSQWSGAPAVMSDEEGAAFSLWGGSIIGSNTKISSNLLEQQWKEMSWENYSTVKFEWKFEGGELEVCLTHTGIPDEFYQNMMAGWDEHYMNPLITWLESNNF